MNHIDYAAILATILIIGIPTSLALIGVLVFRFLDRLSHQHRTFPTLVWDLETRRWVPVASKRRGRS